MSKWVQIKKKPVLPVYLFGLVWILCGILLPIWRLWAFLLTLALSAAVFVAAGRLCPARVQKKEVPFLTGSDDADQMLESIQQQLKALQELNQKIPDAPLSAAMTRMEKAGQGILTEVEKSPEKARIVRRFANYYLPDAVRILSAFAQLEENAVQGENSAQVRREVQANAASIATAFENQLDSLYADTALDISTDLEVLNGMLKGQGLSR